jgi:ABC-type branched-subunit amino acid transport system substrate-binding protein
MLSYWRCLQLVAMGATALLVGLCQAQTDPLAIGRAIYQQGMLASGQVLQGVGPADMKLTGRDAACITCHRRSGYGSSEGAIEVRAITGPALFGSRVAPPAPGRLWRDTPVVKTADTVQSAAQLAQATALSLRAARTSAFAGARQRPAYDESTLARAITEGVDLTGRKMNASMPRFALQSAELESLSAYLKTLSAQTSPGVTEEAIHFATVIQPGTDPQQRQAVVDVLQTFFHDRNLSMRVEQRREEAGMVRLQRSYHEWVLHVWDLSGPSDTWDQQLQAFNQRQPVFALLSGLGKSSWRPIHEFSERFEIPCIFPQTDLPVLTETDFYTVYLSRGLTLEAQALARFLRDQGAAGPLTQVFRSDDGSATAAQAFAQAWSELGGVALREQVLSGPPDQAFWQQLASQSAQTSLVLWLTAQDLAQAQALTASDSQVKAVYLSASLNESPRSALAASGEGRVRLVYPQELPTLRETRIEFVRRWLHSKGLAPTHETLQVNAYLAATVTGMLMSHSMDMYSRENLVERMEHRLGTGLELSIFPHLSLGPGQRYASKGSYIVQVSGAQDSALKALSDWIVP